jgi:hypothetical protein
MSEMPIIPRPSQCRCIPMQVRRFSTNGVSSAEIVSRLRRIPDAVVGFADESGRLRVARSETRIFVFADVGFAESTLVVGVQGCSLLEARKSVLKKIVSIGFWVLLFSAFLSLTGVSDSLRHEWARKSGASNSLLVSELIKTGKRPTPTGVFQSQRPVSSLELVLADPTLLSAIFASLAIISALSAASVRILPDSFWEAVGNLIGIPTSKQVREAAASLQADLLTQLREKTK